MRTQRWSANVGSLVALAALVGCSGSSGTFATVSGTVTNNGAPVDGATVTFHSTVESSGQRGTYAATTDSSGKYLIASVGKDPGIPVGMYKVTITKLDLKNQNLPPDFDAGQMEASGMAKNVMPKDYESLANTKFSVTLEQGKNENKNFDMKGKASNTTAATP